MATKKYLDDTGLSYFWSKIKALIPTTWAASSTANGVATKAASIPFGKVDSTSTSTAFTATVNGITELSDGVCVMLKNGVVTSASGWTLNVNGLGAKPVYRSFAASSRTTTWFNVNYTMLFVYNSTRITGGCWDMFEGYWSDSNNVGVYNRPTYVRLKTKTNLYRYQMLLSYSDTELLPINAVNNDTGTSKTLTTESFDPFGPIYYYYNENTVNANTVIPDSRLWAQRDMNLRYSFNTGTTLTANKSIYLVAVPQDDGKAKLYSTPIVQEIPATDNGLIYIYLGTAYSNYQLQLNEKHPIYYYKDGAVRLWTNPYQRIFTTLIPTGTFIPANADLNSIEYLKVGMYYNNSDNTVKDFTNCPTKYAFMMEVYSPLSKTIDNESSQGWVYRLRKITDYFGNIYIQSVNSSGTAGNFNYRTWQKIAKTSDIPDLSNYVTKSYLEEKCYDKGDVEDLFVSQYSDYYDEVISSVTIAGGETVKIMDYPDISPGWDEKTTKVLLAKEGDDKLSVWDVEIICGSDGIYAKNQQLQSRTINSLQITLVRKDYFADKTIYYATCDSGATSTAKVLTANYIPNPFPGMHLAVKFTYKFGNSPITLFWDETDLGTVVSSGTTTGVALDVRPNQVVEFVYDGTYWHMLNTVEASTEYYGMTKLTDSVTSTNTDTAATPNSVKQAYDLADGKQDALVSGTNIKTINGNSLLGSGNITISGGSSTNQKTWFGECTVSGQSRAVTCEGFVLEDGAHISIFFDYAVTTSSLFLNINNTGSKHVQISASSTFPQYGFWGGEIVDFVYYADYGYYFAIGKTYATTTYYGVTKLTNSTSSTSTTTAATPNSVKQAYDLANSQKTTITTGSVTATNIYSDGKQVYVKRIAISALPNNSSSNIPVDIAESVTPFKIEGMAHEGNTYIQIPYVPYGSLSDGVRIQYGKGSKKIYIASGGNKSSYSGYVDFYFTYD